MAQRVPPSRRGFYPPKTHPSLHLLGRCRRTVRVKDVETSSTSACHYLLFCEEGSKKLLKRVAGLICWSTRVTSFPKAYGSKRQPFKTNLWQVWKIWFLKCPKPLDDFRGRIPLVWKKLHAPRPAWEEDPYSTSTCPNEKLEKISKMIPFEGLSE